MCPWSRRFVANTSKRRRGVSPRAVSRVNPAVLLLEPGLAAYVRSLLLDGRTLDLAVEASTPEEEAWLQERWLGLASVLDLPIELALAADQATVLVRQEPSGFGFEGFTSQTEQGWLVQWSAIAAGSVAGDRHTQVHELAHTLGLSHPEGKPSSRRYNTASTLMSYRPGPQGWNDAFRPADLAALQQLWNPAVRDDGLMPWFTSRGTALIPVDQRLQAPPEGAVLSGVAANDLLIGAAGQDTLQGGAGRDWLTGAEGSDQLWGGPGADMLIGGPGADWIDAGGGADIVASCRDGVIDVIRIPARSSRRAVPLIEALDRVDRIELLGALRKARISIASTRLDGLEGLGVSLNGRLSAVVADPWITARQLDDLIVLA